MSLRAVSTGEKLVTSLDCCPKILGRCQTLHKWLFITSSEITAPQILVTALKHGGSWSSLKQMESTHKPELFTSKVVSPVWTKPKDSAIVHMENHKWNHQSGYTGKEEQQLSTQPENLTCSQLFLVWKISGHSRGVSDFLFPFCWDPPEKMPRPQPSTFFYRGFLFFSYDLQNKIKTN